MQSNVDIPKGLPNAISALRKSRSSYTREPCPLLQRVRTSSRPAVAMVLLILALAPQDLWAATAAYWRHEEGPVGGLIPAGPDTVLDSSGNGQHMETFDPNFTSATYTSTVSPLALRSGLSNTLALDFGPGGDDPGQNDDNFTNSKSIHTQLFTEMTFELAFNMNSIGGFQALMGKDGKPLGDDPNEPDSPVPPLKIMVRGDDFPPDPNGAGVDNQLFVEWIDGDGDIHFLATGETVTAGSWNHVALTLTSSTAELWVAAETGDYLLKDSITGEDFAGSFGEVLIFEPLGFSVGRGMFNNGVTDWSDAIIDEVRISDTALDPNSFLFVTVPATSNADFDGDNLVTGLDFVIWQRNFGLGGQTDNSNGDANGDGVVDSLDLAEWETQYGGPPPLTANAAVVPEPSALTLLLGLLVAGGSCCRWYGRR